MSFIYDDEKLINDLLKSAIDFENRFLKKGQQTAPPPQAGFKPMNQVNTDPSGDKLRAATALKMLDEIDRASPTGEALISSTTDAADLKAVNMENLGALIAFLVQNGITVDYKPIALNSSETPPDQSYRLYKLEGNAGFLEVADRSRQTRGYYISKDLLLKYLLSLKSHADKQEIRVMQVQLGRLIDQANKQLGLKFVEPPKDKEKPEDGGAAKGPSPQDMTIINNMVSPGNLPLDLQTIDFGRIRRFLVNFEKLLASSNHQEKASLASIAEELRGSMNQAAQLARGSERISLNGDWRSVKQMLSDGKTPITGKYQPFCNTLQTVVEDAGKIVDAFFAMYDTQIFSRPQYAAAKAELDMQSQNSNSYKTRNLAVINTWLNDIDKAVHVT